MAGPPQEGLGGSTVKRGEGEREIPKENVFQKPAPPEGKRKRRRKDWWS